MLHGFEFLDKESAMKTVRAIVGIVLCLAGLARGVEVAGDLYTQNFTGADGTVPAGWAIWGTDGSVAKVEIRSNALYIDVNGALGNLVGVSSPWILPTMPTNGAFIKADYLHSTNLNGSWVQFSGPYAVKYICAVTGTNGQQGFWNGATEPRGGATNVPCQTWTALTKLDVGRGPDGVGEKGVLNFINKKFNVGFWATNVEEYSRNLVIAAQKDVPPRTANDNARFDNVVVYSPAQIAFTNTVLWAPLYSEEFDSPTLGPEWILASQPTVDKYRVAVSQDLSRLEVTVNTNTPANWSWVTAWITFTHANALGRPLRVGEYVETGVTRANGARAGLHVFGRMLRPTTTEFGTNDYISSYLAGAEYLEGSEKYGSPQLTGEERLTADMYDWDKPDGEWNRMGLRLDYADGDFMVVSLFMDRMYATSWLFNTFETNLTSIGLHVQGDGSVTNGKAYFGYLKVYQPSTMGLRRLAGFRSDYTAVNFPPQWQYLWNANGPIGVAANYAPLIWSAGSGVYSFNGQPLSGANYISLNSSGGHPGFGTIQTNHEQYAIAAYTAPYGGEYAITGSYIFRTSTDASDGVRVRVYVDDTLRQSSVVTVSGTNNFDVALGTVRSGSKIYVALGGYGNWNNDSFGWDFSIAATPRRGSVLFFK